MPPTSWAPSMARRESITPTSRLRWPKPSACRRAKKGVVEGQGEFEIVGVCVGACERSEVDRGERVRPGDAVLGLASSGLHTNGYTLARKVLADAGVSYDDVPEDLQRSVGDVYLEPHRAYVREIEALRGTAEVRGMAHVTGGGLVGNLPRALGGFGARLDAGSWA